MTSAVARAIVEADAHRCQAACGTTGKPTPGL
jgi:hypothetical protein